MDSTTRILTNQVAILNALAEITFRTPGLSQAVCGGLWRDAEATKKLLAVHEKARKTFANSMNGLPDDAH